MSESTNDPQSLVRERIERFIDAVDYSLASGGMGSDERQNIAADLREQIEEMLSERAGPSGKPVAIEDVEAVLAELDPPNPTSNPDDLKRLKHQYIRALPAEKANAGMKAADSIAAVLGGSGADTALSRRCGRHSFVQ